MNSNRGALLLVPVLLSVVVGGAHGQDVAMGGFTGVGARAMGMGGAYVAVADDFSAIYWNPAGLAQMRRIEAYGGLYPHSRQKLSSRFYQSSSSDQVSRTKLGSLGLVFPYPTYRGSLVLAGGFNRVKDFDRILSTVDGLSDVRNVHILESARDEGDLGAFSVAGAVDISPSVSLGVSLHVWDGRDTYTQKSTHTDVLDLDDALRDSTSYLRFTDEYDGLSVGLGAVVRGPKGLRFGFTIASPVRYSVEEEWEEKYQYHYEAAADSTVGYSGVLDYDITLPYEFGMGVSWTTFNGVFAGAVSYVDWPQAKYDDPPVGGMTNEDFQSQYRDALRVHLGCEVLIPFIEVKGRLGYCRDPVIFKGPRWGGVDVVQINNERDFWTLGAGVLIDQVLSVDVAWVSGFWRLTEGVTVDERRSSRVLLSAGYHF